MDLDSSITRAFDFELRLPGWLRPTYRGAVCLFGMLMGRGGKILFATVLAMLVGLAGPLRGGLVFLTLIAVAMIAGAVAGLVHGIFQPIQRRGSLGTWITWNLVILTYLAMLSLFAPFSIRDPFVLWAIGSLSALGALGMVLVDDRADNRPSPRMFARLRSRALLFAAPERMWARKQRRVIAYEAGREALEFGGAGQPYPTPALGVRNREMRAELIEARRGLELAGQSHGAGGVELLAVNAWIERLDRTHGGQPAGPGEPAA